jgi:hypothetical protein
VGGINRRKRAVLARRGVSDRVLAKERANEKARAGGELVKENDVSA